MLTLAGHRAVSPMLIAMPLLLIAVQFNTSGIGTGFNLVFADVSLLALMAYLQLRNPHFAELEFILTGAGLYFLTARLAQRSDFLRLLVRAIAGLAAATSVWGLLELFLLRNNLYDLYMTALPDTSGFHRIGATLLHPVVFGAFLVFCLPFCLLLVFMGVSRREQVFAGAATALSLSALLFTGSKGSWIVALLLLTAFLLAFKRRRKLILILSGGAIASVVLWTALFPAQIIGGFESRLTKSQSERIMEWQIAFSGIKETRFIGVGSRADTTFLAQVDNRARHFHQDAGRYLPVDNFALGFLLEEGGAGFLLLLLFLGSLFFLALRSPGRPRASQPWMLAAAAAMAGLCLNSLTFEIFQWWSMVAVFWLGAGMLRGTAVLPNLSTQISHHDMKNGGFPLWPAHLRPRYASRADRGQR